MNLTHVFNPIQCESMQAILKSVSKLFQTNPEKRVVSHLKKIGKNQSELIGFILLQSDLSLQFESMLINPSVPKSVSE